MYRGGGGGSTDLWNIPKKYQFFQCFPKAEPDKTSAEPLYIISYFTLKAGEEEVEVTTRANSDCPPPPRQPAPPPLDFLPHCKVRVKRAGAKRKKFSGIWPPVLSCPVLLTVHVLILPLAFSQQKSLRDVLLRKYCFGQNPKERHFFSGERP